MVEIYPPPSLFFRVNLTAAAPAEAVQAAPHDGGAMGSVMEASASTQGPPYPPPAPASAVAVQDETSAEIPGTCLFPCVVFS